MLQPQRPSPEQQLITSRILWGALTVSMLIYGFVLFSTGKISRIEELSTDLTAIQNVALIMNVMALVVYYVFKNKIQTERSFEKRFPLYVVCWALNESVVLMGFVAVFLTDDGNGLIYAINLFNGVVANILCFPKQ